MIAIIYVLARGEILQCGTCEASASVVHKNELPAGWMILQHKEKGNLIQRVLCPACDAKENERWAPC